jgi:hypothetical protein
MLTLAMPPKQTGLMDEERKTKNTLSIEGTGHENPNCGYFHSDDGRTLLEVSVLLGFDVASLDDWCPAFRQTTWLSNVEEFALSKRPTRSLIP